MSRTVMDGMEVCPICGLQGIKRPIELLPNSGTLMRVLHPDGSEHKYVKYNSIYDLGVSARKRQNPVRIDCPKCGLEGRINHFQNPSDQKLVEYVVVHKRPEGTYGNEGQPKSNLEQHYIRDPKQREIILEKLGLRIHSEEISQEIIERLKNSARKRNKVPTIRVPQETSTCPKCGKEGIKKLRSKGRTDGTLYIEFYHPNEVLDSGSRKKCHIGALRPKIKIPKPQTKPIPAIKHSKYELGAIMTCPECGKKGTIQGIVRPYIRHELGEKGRCLIRTKNRYLLQSVEIPTKSQEVINKSPIRIPQPEKPSLELTSLVGTVIKCPHPKCRKEGKEGTLQKFFDKEKEVERYRVKHFDGTSRHYIRIKKAARTLRKLEDTLIQGGNH